jgi:hypothetical protein
VRAYRWGLRAGWVILAIWLACSIGEAEVDKQFQAAVLTLVAELLILGLVEMVCHAVRESKRL